MRPLKAMAMHMYFPDVNMTSSLLRSLVRLEHRGDGLGTGLYEIPTLAWLLRHDFRLIAAIIVALR